MKYILASGSPRRKELMNKISDSFEIITSDIDERAIENRILEKYKGKPTSMKEAAVEICQELALSKAMAVKQQLLSKNRGLSDFLIIGADTSVALSDEILGKPVDRDDAVRMLRKESLDTQYVVTGVAFVTSTGVKTFAEITKVIFKPLDDAQEKRIQDYCDTDEPYDKAGAYAIQFHANTLVDRYEGDFDNIVGFPVNRIKQEMRGFE